MASSRIVELAAAIQKHTLIVDGYFLSQDKPPPTWDVSAPPILMLPPNIQQSQNVVLEATDELNTIMLGPARFLASQSHNSWVVLQAVQRLGLANSFPVNETSDFETIAKNCNVDEDDVKRILRYAMTYRIFREPEKGVVAHTAASKVLAQVPALRDLLGFISDEMWPSATRAVDAIQKWPGSQEPNQTGFAIANNTEETFFTTINHDPKRTRQMASAMAFSHSQPGQNMKPLLDFVGWEPEFRGTVVDIGGAAGEASIEVAKYFKNVRCVVQDLPDVIACATIPENLVEGGRLSFMEHDFFKTQPIKDADLYLLRWVLHDWSDKYAIKILQNIIPALKKGAIVAAVEICIPQPGTAPILVERRQRLFDIAMKAMQNAKERDADDWKALFANADERFSFQGVKTPPGSQLSFISAIWGGE